MSLFNPFGDWPSYDGNGASWGYMAKRKQWGNKVQPPPQKEAKPATRQAHDLHQGPRRDKGEL